jgi:hypothetical protein
MNGYETEAKAQDRDPLDQSIDSLTEEIQRTWAKLQGLLDTFEQRTERMIAIRSDFRQMRGNQSVPR